MEFRTDGASYIAVIYALYKQLEPVIGIESATDAATLQHGFSSSQVRQTISRPI
jgi:hypothetical protein